MTYGSINPNKISALEYRLGVAGEQQLSRPMKEGWNVARAGETATFPNAASGSGVSDNAMRTDQRKSESVPHVPEMAQSRQALPTENGTKNWRLIGVDDGSFVDPEDHVSFHFAGAWGSGLAIGDASMGI